MTSKPDKSKPAGDKPAGLPLLYSRPTPLDAVRHSTASISKTSDFSFAKHTNSLPINALEFVEVAKHYPIVFTSGENIFPVAIVGLEQDNYFVRPDNSWQEGAYIPAYLRQYPFIFYERPEDKKLYLCVDEVSNNFSSSKKNGAHMLYDDKGKPTDFTNNILQMCTAFYQHHLITSNFCADLKEHKLLQQYQSEVVLKSGKKVQLSGFQMIDEKALKELPNKAYLALRDKGWLPFIYIALASVSNWKNLIEMEAK